MKTSILSRLKSAAGVSATITAAALPSTALAGDISVNVTTDYVSEYVFRGVSFANTAIQPGISVTKGNFTVGAWASTGLGETSAIAGDEIDIYASYDWSLNDTVSASVGGTIYHFPQSGGLFNFDQNELGSTFEASAGLSFDTILSPSITAYYDFTLDAFTGIGSVSHTVPLQGPVSLGLGLTGGFVTAGNGGTDYQWGTANASLNYQFNDDSSFYVGGNFTLNSEDFLDFPTADDIVPNDNLFWGGVGFSTNF